MSKEATPNYVSMQVSSVHRRVACAGGAVDRGVSDHPTDRKVLTKYALAYFQSRHAP